MEPSKWSLKATGSSLHPDWVWELVHFECQTSEGAQDSLWPQKTNNMTTAAQHSVHLTGGSRRVFKQFAWLEVDSDKMAFSCPAHQQVTQTVGQCRLSQFNTK
jgi:hypothetical protein